MILRASCWTILTAATGPDYLNFFMTAISQLLSQNESKRFAGGLNHKPSVLDHKLDIRYCGNAAHESAATDCQRCITPAQRSFDAKTGDGPRNNQLLDLLGAFEDVVDIEIRLQNSCSEDLRGPQDRGFWTTNSTSSTAAMQLTSPQQLNRIASTLP